MSFDLGRRRVGAGPCLIVAEIAQAHDGSLGMAHAYIDAVAKAGADAVKFQCHIADAESSLNEAWRVEPRWRQDRTRFDYWKRMEFTPEQWAGLERHADGEGLIFLCSPFSVEAVELLDGLVPAWKVASGEVCNAPLLEAINRTGKPVILSSGMTTLAELERAWASLTAPKAVLQCTSAYPCRLDEIGLGLLAYFQKRFDCPVGLSDHSGKLGPSLGAVALGAAIVEVHVCFEGAFSLDADASLTPKQLKRLVKGAWEIEQARKPVDKDRMAQRLEPMREVFLEKWKRKGLQIPAEVARIPSGDSPRNVPAAASEQSA